VTSWRLLVSLPAAPSIIRHFVRFLIEKRLKYSKPRIYLTRWDQRFLSVICEICYMCKLDKVNRTMSVLHDEMPHTNWRGPSRPEHPHCRNTLMAFGSKRLWSDYDAPPQLPVFPLLRA
jgi:hypothetical protein